MYKLGCPLPQLGCYLPVNYRNQLLVLPTDNYRRRKGTIISRPGVSYYVWCCEVLRPGCGVSGGAGSRCPVCTCSCSGGYYRCCYFLSSATRLVAFIIFVHTPRQTENYPDAGVAYPKNVLPVNTETGEWTCLCTVA